MWQRFERWREGWADWRNRTLQNPDFQRWAASFWLTRPLARREAAEIFDLVAGFIYSQVLLALVRSRILQDLSAGPREDRELRRHLGVGGLDLSDLAIDTLLKAAVSLDLLERRSQARWALGPKAAALMGNPGVLAMIEHHAVLYQDLVDPLALLRAPRGESRLSRYWSYAQRPVPGTTSSVEVKDYTRLMAASQSLVAAEILDAYDLAPHRQVLDVGGGNGTFLRAVAQRHPSLGLALFDLPAVAEWAQQEVSESRVRVHAGDFTRDPLPEGADLITLVRILHDHDDDRVLQLLQAIRRVVPASGRLLIAEPLAETRGARRMGHAYFGFYLYAMGSGRPRTVKELAELLEKAGFSPPREYPTRVPLQTRVLVSGPAS